MRGIRSVRTEYRRCQKVLAHLRAQHELSGRDAEDWTELRGVQQALAWVLGDDAMAPVKSTGWPRKRVRK